MSYLTHVKCNITYSKHEGSVTLYILAVLSEPSLMANYWLFFLNQACIKCCSDVIPWYKDRLLHLWSCIISLEKIVKMLSNISQNIDFSHLFNIYTCHWLSLGEPFKTNWLHKQMKVNWSCDVVVKQRDGTTNVLIGQRNVRLTSSLQRLFNVMVEHIV